MFAVRSTCDGDTGTLYITFTAVSKSSKFSHYSLFWGVSSHLLAFPPSDIPREEARDFPLPRGWSRVEIGNDDLCRARNATVEDAWITLFWY
jgi:hypothetical protein